VAQAEGELWAAGALVIGGELKRSTGGGGTVITTASGEPFNPASELDGRMPERSGEVALLRATAEKYGLEPGAHIGVAGRGGTARVTVVGSYELGNANAGGTDIVSAPLSDIQRWFDRRGEVTSINVAADHGVSPEELARRLRRAVPAGLEVRTGDVAAEETAADINEQIGGFLTPALLAFAGAALLVGAFTIFNTFTITVAERTREFAMLRTLGATRGQILGAVAVEALAIGLTASLLGLGLGLMFAKGLAALFEAVGLGIPTGALGLSLRTIGVSLLVGVGVTQLAALAPARRATRIAPIATLQGQEVERSARRRRAAPLIAALVAAAGVALLVAGLFASGPATGRLSTMAAGVVLLFVGVALSARWFVRPLAGAVGWPLERLFAEPGLLARENAMRNPGRTAATAAALMVGLGLVVFVSVFANGIKASFDKTVSQVVKADLVVRSETMQPIPGGASSAVARTPDVAATSSVLIDQVKVDGHSSNAVTDIINGVAPANFAQLYRANWVQGNDALLPEVRGRTALVEQQFSKKHGVGVGDSYRIETPSGGTVTLRAIGIYRDPQLLQGSIVSRDLFESVSAARDPWMIFADTDPGVPADLAKRRVQTALAPFPTATAESQADYGEAISDQLDQFVFLLYALLALSVVISLFGIANSLFLSIHERTREFGLLRAIGATRAQVRRMVRYESVITAVIGGLLGTAIGLLFAFLVTRSLDDLGLGFALPLGQLLIFLLLAVAVGVIAAVGPARRGARLPVLEALRSE
jgi:putative ABC transport system permease protein